VFELFDEMDLVSHVKKTAPYLEKKLDELVSRYDFLAGRRGAGFMQGLIVKDRPVGEIVKKALANGLVVLSAGSDVLRLVPPLVITETDIDEMIRRLEASF
jgi:acetylornithine/N-succinyldiaminopimelate aminotransferase